MKKASTATTKATTKAAAPKTVAGVPLPTRGTLRGATRVTTALDDAGMMPNPAILGGSRAVNEAVGSNLPSGTDMAALAELIRAGVASMSAPAHTAKANRPVRALDENCASTAEVTPVESAMQTLRDQLLTAEHRFGELIARLEPVLSYPQDEASEGRKDPAYLSMSPLHRQINEVMERVASLSHGLAVIRDRVTV